MNDYRFYTAKGMPYDRSGAEVFCYLLELGLEPTDLLLDVGCGSLRVGRFLLNYLEPQRYCGIEPNTWLLEAAFKQELGNDIIELKRPHIIEDSSWNLRIHGKAFDIVLLSTILVHASHDIIKKVFDTAPLASKGFMLFDYHPQGPHYEETAWNYPGLSPHELECFTRPAQAVGLQLTPFKEDQYGSYWVVARRA